jgi:predicted TIM-barrel fold metal-dependent hydrolase
LIDIHTHIYPRTYIELLKQNGCIPRITGEKPHEKFLIFPPSIIDPLNKNRDKGVPIGPEFWSLEHKLEFMDKYKIQVSLMSLGNPWLSFLNPSESRKWARILNDEIEQLCEKRKDRLLGLGCLPTNCLDATLEEIERICKTNLHGAIMECRMLCGKKLDNKDLEPFWDKLNKTHFGIGMEELTGYSSALPLSLGFAFETTLAATRIVCSGVFERYPNLKIILAHSGGALPFLSGRIDAAWKIAHPKLINSPPSSYMKYFFYDSICYHSPALIATVRFASASKLMFGTDHPFGISQPDKNIEAIIESNLTKKEQNLIFTDNAKKLFEI